MSTGPSGGGPASWTTGSSGAVPSAGQAIGQLGRYRLCAELASGGMGTVYLARADGPHGFEKLVALKSIHPHLAKDRRFVEMFFDEARIAARLAHPNVCGVIDFGEAGGTYYLTMPFLLGESLAGVQRALRRSEDAELRGASPFVIARLLADACEGLHAAHELRDERGEPLAVVHRDVSPQNLFVGFEGTMSVLDFGVASARHRLHSTATGEVKGKFSYAAPEQLESRPIDRRADVWSLGVVLWEHAVMRRLFARADAGATIRAVLESPIPPLRDLWPEAPLGLEEIVFRALARDPDRRYATAREMGRDLLAFLSEEGQGIGSPHVAEWLERLMPEARGEKAKLVERARATGGVDASAVVVREEAPAVASTGDASTENDRVGPTDSADAGARAGRRGMVVGVGIGVVLAAAAVVLAIATGGGAGATETPHEAPPGAEVTATPPVAPSASAAPAASPSADPARESASDSAPAPGSASPSLSDATSISASPPASEATTDPPDTSDADEVAVARGRGTVSVATPGGWALVYRGDRMLGEAPGTFAMPAGPTTLRIQPFGRGQAIRRRVRVPAAGTVRVSVPVR